MGVDLLDLHGGGVCYGYGGVGETDSIGGCIAGADNASTGNRQDSGQNEQLKQQISTTD